MEKALIYGLMAKISAEAPVIGKDRKNREQHFQFRGIDDIYTALHGIMAKYEVFCTSQILSCNRYTGTTKKGTDFVDAEIMVRYTFWGPDGSSVSTETVGVGRDYADKYASKALAIAHKYALVQAFTIPTNEPDNDPDANTIQGSSVRSAPQKPTPPMTQEQVGEIIALIDTRELTEDERRKAGAWLKGERTQEAAAKMIEKLKALPEVTIE